MVGLALTLGLVFAMSLLAGLALARGPGGREAGAPRIGAPASILATASITGRVTYAADGTPVAAGTVGVNVQDGVSRVFLKSVFVGAGGYYSVTVTAPYSNVKILFTDAGGIGTAQEWYNDKAYFSTADAIDISAGGVVTGVNISLEKKGAITGTVMVGGSTPVAGAFVQVYNAYKSLASNGWTDANGRYTITVPYAGTHAYFVEFGSPSIVTEWYQDQDSLDAATPVTVTAGTTVTVNADVTVGGWITGVVTDAVTTLPIDGVWVGLYDQSDNYLKGINTNPSGAYSLARLATGYYKVRFGHIDYVEEFYDDQSTLDLATPVSVTAGITTPNISAALTPTTPTVPPAATGAVTGTVTKNGGNPLGGGDGVVVVLYDAGTGQYSNQTSVWWYESPTYVIQNVQSGTYKALFVPGSGAAFAPEWYSDTASMAVADVVTVTTGMTTTDVNADMVTATGCISGVVTANVAGANPGVSVQRYYTEALLADPLGRYPTTTGADGTYKECGLKGNYLVKFYTNPYIPEWYDDAPSTAGATTVSVTNGVTSTANATLTLGGCASGQVTDVSGRPQVIGVTGRVYDSAGDSPEFYVNGSGDLQTFFNVDADGSFVLCGFPTGNYSLWCGLGTAEWLQGTVPVTITAGQETTGVTCVVAVRLYLPLVLRSSGS